MYVESSSDLTYRHVKKSASTNVPHDTHKLSLHALTHRLKTHTKCALEITINNATAYEARNMEHNYQLVLTTRTGIVTAKQTKSTKSPQTSSRMNTTLYR